LWLHFHTQLHLIITLQHKTILIDPLFSGTFQSEPATNWFDESFAPILKSHERFARQQRSRPSITYHVTSASSRIDHQLSGIKNTVLLYENIFQKIVYKTMFHFHYGKMLQHSYLTVFSNSLIRVTRRDKQTNDTVQNIKNIIRYYMHNHR